MALTQDEINVIKEQVGVEATAKAKNVTDALEQKMDEFEKKFAKGDVTPTKQDVEDLKKTIADKDTELENIIKTQGETIESIRKQLGEEEETSGVQSVGKALEAKKDAIHEVVRNKTGAVVFNLGYRVKNGRPMLVAKAADVHSVANVVSQELSSAALLRIGAENDMIETINRNTPWILDFVSVGNTTASALTWFEEIARQGDFAVTAEGAVKPLVQYSFKRQSSGYKKAAGRAKLTEEFNMDFPFLVSLIRDLMRTDCRNEMNDIILADMIANAVPYSNAALVGQIDNADDWAAIAAVSGQLGNSFYTPNVIVMNNNQGIASAAVKDNDGQYVDYTPIMKEINAGGIRMIRNPDVAFGNVLMGDANFYKVLLRGDLQVRIGYSNDDFDRNQFSMVVEQFFYSYIAGARQGALVYDSLSDIKASIEKV